MDDIICELKTEHCFSDEWISALYTNADILVDEFAIIYGISNNQHQCIAELMKGFYPLYFNYVADSCIAAKKEAAKNNNKIKFTGIDVLNKTKARTWLNIYCSTYADKDIDFAREYFRKIQ